MKRLTILFALIVALVVSALTVTAKTAVFTLDWFSVDGGGGTSGAASYALAGSIGQPDAGAMSGGQYTIAGGFQSAGILTNKTPTRTPTKTAIPARTSTPTVTPTSCAVLPAKPVLLKPKNNAVTTRTRVTLKWQAAVCAQTYNVSVKDAVTKKKVDAKRNLTVLQYKTKVLPAGSYKWTVKACDAVGCVRSGKRTFTIQP